MAIRGTTLEERRAARVERTRQNRVTFFIGEIRKAKTPRQRLQQSCQFAKAVGDDLPDEGRDRLAKAIAEAAEDLDKEYRK